MVINVLLLRIYTQTLGVLLHLTLFRSSFTDKIIHDRIPRKGCVQDQVTSINFWEITDEVFETL